MAAINTIQNTQRPSKSYLSGYFKAIFQREATPGSERSPCGRPTRGHTGRPPAICGQIGTAQSKQRAAPLALLHSFTPLSSCAIVARPFADAPLSPHESPRTMRLKDPFLPGEIDPLDPDKGFKLSKPALQTPPQLSAAIILNASAPRVRARQRGVHHQHVFTIFSLVLFF